MLILQITLLTLSAILFLPALAWANGIVYLPLYIIIYPFTILLTAMIKIILGGVIGSDQEPQIKISGYIALAFFESVLMYVSDHLGQFTVIILFGLFDPHYSLYLGLASVAIFLPLAWLVNLIWLRTHYLKALVLSVIFPVIFFSLGLLIYKGYSGYFPLKGKVWQEFHDSEQRVLDRPELAYDFERRGDHHLRAGRYREAISDFTRSIQLDPKRNAYLARGKAYLLDGKLEMAIADFTKSLELDSGNLSRGMSYSLRGEAYFLKEEFDQAWLDVQRAEKLGYSVPKEIKEKLCQALGKEEIDLFEQPRTAKEFLLRGEKNAKLGRKATALADFTQAIDLEPNNSWHYRTRGHLLWQEGQFDAAIADYTRAVELDPHYKVDIFKILSEIHLQKGDYQSSLKFSDMALEILKPGPAEDFKIADLRKQKVRAYLMLGRPVEALLQYRLVYPYEPDLEGYFLRGEICKQKGEYDQAIDDYSRCVVQRSEGIQSFLKLQPSQPKAFDYPRIISESKQRLGECLLARAETYFLKGDHDKAWADVHEAEKLGHSVPPDFKEKLRQASGRDK